MFPDLASRSILLIFGVALGIRLISMGLSWWLGGVEAFAIEDSTQFLLEAKAYAEAGSLFGFAADGTGIYNPQIMPLAGWLFAWTGVTDVALAWRVILIQHVLDAATCVVIGLTAGLLSPRYALPAGLAAALNPTMIVVSNMMLSDTLCLFFYAILIYAAMRLILRGDERAFPFWQCVALGSLGITGAVFSRYVSLHLSVFLIGLLAVLILCRFGFQARERLGALALTALIAAAAIQPIAWRNFESTGHYSFSLQSGVHLLYWVVPMARDLSGMQPQQEAEREAQNRLQEISNAAGDGFAQSRTMESLGAEMLRETGVGNLLKAWVLGSALNVATPALAINPILRALPHDSFYATPGNGAVGKVFTFLTAAQNQPYGAIVAAMGLATVAWLALCAYGCVPAARTDFFAVLLLFGWCAAVLAVTGPIVSPKYRLPMEPALCVFIGAALSTILHRLRGFQNAVR